MLHLFFIFSSFIFLSCASNPHYQKEKAHHTPTGFQNVYIKDEKSFWQFLQWRWQRFQKDIPPSESYKFEVVSPQLGPISKNKPYRFTWLGHAGVLANINGVRVLTDPHLSLRASPFSWAGPKRAVDNPIEVEKLPPIDYVVISHDHYDSLDVETLKRLHASTPGKNTTYLVPLGLKSWFQNLGINNVIELDWWQEYKKDGIQIIAVPVQHWSKRSFFDAFESLWAGWIIKSQDFTFFFAGDTGYAPHFKEIGRRYGPIDFSAIPIGAYDPRWFMKDYHVNPEEAVQIHQDVGSKKSLGIHWGTFVLTDEPLDEPPKRLKSALEKKGLSKEEFQVLKHGQSIELE